MKKITLQTVCLGLLVAVFFPTTGFSHPRNREVPHLNFLFESVQSQSFVMRYAIALPTGYDPSREWPVILFLHGSGETGDDGTIQTTLGLGPAIEKNPSWFPAIILFPQTPGTPQGIKFSSGPLSDELEATVMQTLEKTIQRFHGDRSRVYLTGLSRGGGGTWRYGSNHTDIFAALLPVAGFGNIRYAATLNNTPIWAFHGDADTTVDIQLERKLVDAVRKSGNPEMRFTVYPGFSHNVWDVTYTNPDVIAWMFSKTK